MAPASLVSLMASEGDEKPPPKILENIEPITTYLLLVPVELFPTETNYIPPDIAMTHQLMEVCCCLTTYQAQCKGKKSKYVWK